MVIRSSSSNSAAHEIKVVIVELGDAVQRRKDAVLRWTGKVGDAIERAVVLANGLVQFDAGPDAGGKLRWSWVVEIKPTD